LTDIDVVLLSEDVPWGFVEPCMRDGEREILQLQASGEEHRHGPVVGRRLWRTPPSISTDLVYPGVVLDQVPLERDINLVSLHRQENR
jgi:hypothetical protein